MIEKRLINIEKTFIDYFGETSIKLKRPFIVDKVEVFDIVGSGWNIQYKLFYLDDELVLDLFAHHRMTNSRHQRIHEDGKREFLESFWEFGFTVYENDPVKTETERNKIIEKNEKVQKELQAKGFTV